MHQVKLKCVQTLRTIFLHPERNISTPYIHALAPRLVEYLYSDKSKQVTNDMELTFTLECISTVEALIGLADLSNRKLNF
jgi:hypothetical protein